jgi:hypothetical protein
MKRIKILFTVIATFVLTVSVYGQVGINKLAQSTMNFQLVSTSPKASAMGEAYYSVGRNSDAIFYNPAGIAGGSKTFDVTFNYTGWIADIKYLAGAVTYNMEELGTVGFSVLSVNYGDIIGTRLARPSELSEYPDGYIETGLVSNVGAYSIGLSYAKQISTQFAIGGNVRYVGQNLGNNTFSDGTSKENNATKLAFDAGVLYNTGFKDFKFGMAIRNFSSNIKREAIDEQLPLTFTIGASIDVMQFVTESKDEQLNVAVDFLHSNSYSERLNVGAEYRFLGMLALRAGYQTNRDIASWSAGAGFNTSLSGYDVEVNYSFSKMEIFDNVNRLSLNFAF